MPRYFHGLVLGRTTGRLLNRLDNEVRKFVRQWLHLPNDTPLGYFYASFSDGGLGLPNLGMNISATKIRRLSKLSASDSPISRAVAALPVIIRQLYWRICSCTYI